MGITIFLIALGISKAQADAPQNWLAAVNYYRAQSGLPPVSEDTSLSQADALHARYSVENRNLIHSEDQSNRWYTPEGDQAARTSNGAAVTSESNAVDQWMQAPFHALGILDPRLQRVGFGTYTDSGITNGSWNTSAWLNVISGMGPLPARTRFPIVWPGENSSISITQHTGEVPEVIKTCHGYSLPTGVPLIVELAPGASTTVTDSKLEQNGVPVAHCTFDAPSFNYPDSAWQTEARNILSARNAVVIIPKKELAKGSQFRMTLTIGGQEISWSFRTE
jgi:hypothetical protein